MIKHSYGIKIKLGKKAYPFVRTATGDKLMAQLHVDLQRVKNNVAEQMKRYAYCLVIGAAREGEIEFNFRNVDEFIQLCPRDWKLKVTTLINLDVKEIEAPEIEAAENVEEKKKA